MSNEHNLFFQQTEAGEQPVYGSPTVRTRAKAPCPGQLSNIVTLVSGQDAFNGISRSRNVGTCPLHIACYDASGTFIEALRLEPDEMLNWYQVPSNTRTIKFGCHKACAGTAILEYDTPYIS